MNYGEAKDHLSGRLHGADVDDIENLPELFERAQNEMLSKVDPVDTIRVAPLSQTIHDDVFNYALASDFKDPIDLYPQDDRDIGDVADRRPARLFDLKKAIAEKQVSVEASEGTKYLRVNWRSRAGTVLHSMNSLTSDGTWSAVTGASGVALDTIFKISGTGSIKFNLTATGGGIQNTTISALDLSGEDEVADIFVWVYLPSTSITSVACRFGNDLTANYWTPTAQTTQADGTAFKVGWNLIRFAWNGATETGTVDPATVDSFRVTINGSTAINNIRVDNIIFSIGRNFDLKYYSKFIFKNSSGTWITKPNTDSDTIVLDNDASEIFLNELLIEAAHQIESSNSAGDIQFAQERLNGNPRSPDPKQKLGLYAAYKRRYPSLVVKSVGSYGSLPARGRW